MMKRGAQSIEFLSGLDVIDEIVLQAPGLEAGTPLPRGLRERIEGGLAEAGRRTDAAMEAFGALRKAAQSRVAADFGEAMPAL
jgi:hypothetical protein